LENSSQFLSKFPKILFYSNVFVNDEFDWAAISKKSLIATSLPQILKHFQKNLGQFRLLEVLSFTLVVNNFDILEKKYLKN